MKTSMLIVEYLVGGVLVLLAVGFLVVSFIPDVIKNILSSLKDYPLQSTGVLILLSTIFVAVAYTLGIFSELFARETFEWLLNIVKKDQLKNYLNETKKMDLDLTNDPIFVDKVRLPTGLMRFYVLMKSPDLYQDIASQLHRFRLMRILFLADTICIVAVIRQLFRGSSSLWIWILVILLFIAHMDFIMIYDRFKRYCRSIERSYTILMLGKGQDTLKGIISQTISETDE